ncbi:receptor expression-enhancing protein 5-like [Rhopalosiphum maidis]|uniref:receptor expression-enhancing protein 5-like n=1 Tax=Rhopalosiphum maidis TaxID=43146 RepID=UPI000EFE0958|nr:receptor expression-enhancing protein 5-like [Rhopalosiphum maidis]
MARLTKVELVRGVIGDALNDRSKPWHAAFVWAEALTGLPRFRVLLCVVLVASVLFMFEPTAELMSNVFALVLPAVATVSATVSPPVWRKYDRVSAADEARNERFAYWMTFAAVLIVESLCRPVLRFVPLYQMCRTWFFVWCSVPIRDNGSAYVLDAVVRPLFEMVFGSDD